MAVGDRKFRRSTKSPLLPHKHHHQQHRDVFASEVGFSGASFSGAVFNLSTTIVGAGIMALPATLKQLGLIPGLILIALGAILTEFSIDVILRFSKSSKCTSYAGLAGDAFGGVGRTVLQLCVVVNNLGTLVVYLIIIGKSVTLPILVFQFPVNSGLGFGSWSVWYDVVGVMGNLDLLEKIIGSFDHPVHVGWHSVVMLLFIGVCRVPKVFDFYD